MKSKLSLKRLINEHRFLTDLVNRVPTLLMVIGPDTSIRYVNPAFEELTGYSFPEVTGTKAPYPWWRRKTCGRQLQELKACLKGGRKKQEIPVICKDGSLKWLEAVWIPLSAGDEECAGLIAAWDITGSRQLIESLQSYIKRVTELRETEHANIASQLHEGILQSLAALNLSIESVIKTDRSGPERLIPRLGDLQTEITGVINEIRQISYVLKPGILGHLGLMEALEALVDEVNAEEQVKARFSITGIERPLPSNVETNLYLIAQEALKNAEKHSQAKRIRVNLLFTPRRIKLTVSDNGKGFEVPEKLPHFANLGKIGLVGMENWTLLLNGKIQVKSRLNRGTSVIVGVQA